MTGGEALPFPSTPHRHLRLAAALPPQPRLRRSGGAARPPSFPDRASHARTVRADAVQAIRAHHVRSPVLGVDPELVLVIELEHRLDPEELERAELHVLDLMSDRVIVAFASDPELTEFLRRLDAYSAGPRPGPEPGSERSAAYETLFDAISMPRRLGVDDVLSLSLRSELARATDEVIRLDVQCWCPEVASEASRRRDDFVQAVETAGGQVLATDFRPWVGLSLLRIDVPANAVHDLARTDRARSIDLLPRPILTTPQVSHATPSALPLILAPAPNAPLLALIDSGVASAHPLVAPAAYGVEAIGLSDGADHHGHGTFVASLALHGSLEPQLTDGSPMRPAGRLLSIRILDEDNQIPVATLWETTVLHALQRARDAGARVVNLSIGDPRRPYRPPRPTVLAAAIDDLARKLGLVVVISAGNYPLDQHQRDPRVINEYPALMLTDDLGGLLDPATAALGLTVGALCVDHGQGAAPARVNVDRQPLGAEDHPSPVSRVGPGAMAMVKPELCAVAGGYSYDHGVGRLIDKDPSVHVLGAAGARPDRLLATDLGTSYAAPLVSHAALRVLGSYPDLTTNGVRALVLASAIPTPAVVTGNTPAVSRQQQARLTGYGRVSPEQAEASNDHRAVLLAEEVMQVNDVHLFLVPVPGTFMEPGGSRRVTVALAYDPPVRPTRLDYLGSRMDFWAYRGVGAEEVRAAYTAPIDDPDEVPERLKPAHLELQPSTTGRSPGANQWATRKFDTRFKAHQDTIVVVVRNTNRWDVEGATQRYALAVVLERDEWRTALYAELRTQLPLLVEAEVEP
jgi:hypothetical protein